ncbi:MAG: hypothetical protein VKN56_05500 [Cyanobacteriota bacterium]|nr:hypothetical protein [Cyanobacteriota bacterium]
MALLKLPLPKQAKARSQGSVQLLGMAWISLLSCLPAPPGNQPAPNPQAIPEAFLGEWNTHLKACGSPRSEGRLVLEAQHATLFSGRAEIVTLQVENPRRIKLSIRIAAKPEAGGRAAGEPAIPYTLERRYLLSSDLQRLQDISQGEQGMVRWRCPSGRR